jgi:tripartite-type tricarboxylate transporter receptor subunit TctC
VRLLATTGERRTPWTPDVPTLQEQGVTGADVDSWIGMFAPQGTPAPVVQRIYQEVLAVMKSPEVSEALFKGGVEVGMSSSQELRELVRTDLERYRRVIAAAGLRPE